MCFRKAQFWIHRFDITSTINTDLQRNIEIGGALILATFCSIETKTDIEMKT